jgi:alkylhydroperoxidase family enzyme
MHARIDNPAITIPAALQELDNAVRHADVPDATPQLVQLRASQINGCSICVGHSKSEKQAA